MVTSDGLVMETGCFHSQEQELSHALSVCQVSVKTQRGWGTLGKGLMSLVLENPWIISLAAGSRKGSHPHSA